MTSISSIRSLTLDLPPSCIAFCPSEPRHFVVGTYYLHSKVEGTRQRTDPGREAVSDGAQKRSGSLILYRLNEDDTITHIATEETPDFSILDIQWTSHPSALGNLLAVATSTGSIAFYQHSANDSDVRLKCKCIDHICDPAVLVLSLAWHPDCADVIGVTLSDGRVCLVVNVTGELWGPTSKFAVTDVFQHELEAWWLAFRSHKNNDGEVENEVLSGGDDIVLQCSRISLVVSGPTLETTAMWQDRKIHQAGVTAILPIGDDLLLTGSYDDHIRLISAPAIGRRRILAENNLEGGVWRLKVLDMEAAHAAHAALEEAPTALSPPAPKRRLFILASCMHAGTRVVRLQQLLDGEWQFDVLAKFEEHNSMNYGSDVLPTSTGAVKTIVSTSFYDKLLCLWRIHLEGVAEDHA